MNNRQTFRICKDSMILGLHMKPGDYTPHALAKEMNRVLEADGRNERFLWNEKINMFARNIPISKSAITRPEPHCAETKKLLAALHSAKSKGSQRKALRRPATHRAEVSGLDGPYQTRIPAAAEARKR